MWKKILLSPWTAVVTLAFVLAVRTLDPAFVESVRLRYFDTLITSKAVTVSEQIHVVNIDDAAIEKYGQFPFPRNQYADIIGDLNNRGAGVIVFNIFMPDADRFAQDSVLAKRLQTSTVILPHMATNDTVSIDPVQNPKNIEPKQGLFFLDYGSKTYLYEFIIKPIKKGNLETKCHIKRICECLKGDFDEKLKEVKKPLIKNLQDPKVHSKLKSIP